jgi:hypothetical protein
MKVCDLRFKFTQKRTNAIVQLESTPVASDQSGHPATSHRGSESIPDADPYAGRHAALDYANFTSSNPAASAATIASRWVESTTSGGDRMIFVPTGRTSAPWARATSATALA